VVSKVEAVVIFWHLFQMDGQFKNPVPSATQWEV